MRATMLRFNNVVKKYQTGPVDRRPNGRYKRDMPRRSTKPTPEVTTLHCRLNEAMEYAGYSGERGDLRKFSERSHIDVALISRYRRGKSTHGITADMVVRLARFLDVPCGWLLASEGVAPWGHGDTSLRVHNAAALNSVRGGASTEAGNDPTTVIKVPGGGRQKYDKLAARAPAIDPRTPRIAKRK